MSIKEKLGEEKYSALIKSTLLNKGNSYRIKKALQKEKIKLGAVGGSVTYGYTEHKIIEKNFPFNTREYIERNFYNSCKLLNISISGQNSFMGLITSEIDFTKFLPDIVLVEYAVNETLSPEGPKYFESLLRKLLSLASTPAIIMIIVFDENKYTCQEYMLMLAKRYEIPAIALMDSILSVTENGEIEWNDYCIDNVHPTENGHKFISDCICDYLFNIKNSSSSDDFLVMPEPLFSAPYENLHILDYEKINKKQGFELLDFSLIASNSSIKKTLSNIISNKIETDEHFIEFSLNCKNLSMVYIANNETKFGCMDIYIDDKKQDEINSYSIFGWKNPVYRILLNDTETKLHKFKFSMQKGDEKKEFYIHAISYCD